MLAACACVSNPTNNLPLTPESGVKYDFGNWIFERDKLDENLIALSFSGGGVRAAALAASVVEKLDSLGLYDRIAIISSTSGGSVTAGFVAAKGSEKLPELRENFLFKDNTAELAPGIFFSFLSGANRSQKFATYLDKQLFDGGANYDDLIVNWREAPFVILNASNASNGQTFEFTQTSFSTLCSYLGKFRISEAIAASAAFPFLMSPVSLRNNWDQPVCSDGVEPFDDEDYREAFEQRYVNLEQFVRWRNIHALRYTYAEDPNSKPYRPVRFIHLVDGGLSDNLAARALLRSFGENIDVLGDNGVRRILLIQVNAKSDSQSDIDQSGEIPSMIEVFRSVALNPIDVTTALSSYISREYMAALVSHVNNEELAISGRRLYFYPVQVDFDLLENGSDEQMRAKRIKTWWTLSPSEIEFLDGVGKKLLEEHPCFQAFARDSGVQGTPVDSADKCTDFIRIQIAAGSRPGFVAPAPPPASDSDSDGVPDSYDYCPATFMGVVVDEKGCPLDSDGDCVPDSYDFCPATPMQVKVDEKGCPLDSDGDGVPDGFDKCPSTLKEVKVDEKGCPLDGDGDGVPDYR